MARIKPGAGRRWEPWAVAGAVTVLSCAAPALTWIFWSTLEGWLKEDSTTLILMNLQRLVLTAAGAIGFFYVIPTNFWRLFIMHRQTEAAVENTANTTLKEMRERVVLLFSENMASRVAAIESLPERVSELPGEFLVDAARNLCSIARHPLPSVPPSAVDGGTEENRRAGCPPDARAAVFALIEIMKGLAKKGQFHRESGFTPDLSGTDFAGLNFQGAELTRVSFEGAILSRVNLRNANLIEANLEATNLAGADLASANLVKASLAGANLEGVDFKRANLTRANLAKASVKVCDLTGTDLTRANLTGADLEGANLTGADLARVELVGANLTGAILQDAKLENAIGLTREMLRTVTPSGPPALLPPGLIWPFERDEHGDWSPISR